MVIISYYLVLLVFSTATASAVFLGLKLVKLI
uniref:Cytochrome b6-f complex subunit VI n=1 Tax=Microchloropsis salina TaxID=2511165 RepID=A0A023PLY6_9STRA|nr:cytochrome b6-f complex subunit VI [Microchloropsis salina]